MPLFSHPFPADTRPLPAPVRLRHVSCSYGGREKALEDVSLTVRHGEFLALIGPNGGGKTTLLKIMLGLLPPEQGEVDIFGSPPASIRDRIGYVPQFSGLRNDFPSSVLDAVLMGAARTSAFGGSWKTDADAKRKALHYLDILGMADSAHLQISELSGGQRQRALVARSLMGRPGSPEESGPESPFLLLLDEPTSNIDPGGRFCFYEFLDKLRGQVTVIVVSHDFFLNSPFFSGIIFVNKDLTRLEGKNLSPEDLALLFGQHKHECPLADMQHAAGLVHLDDCTHPSCRNARTAPARQRPGKEDGCAAQSSKSQSGREN